MEEDRDLAWRLQLEEFFTPEQIELLNLSGRQRPERMAEMTEFLHDLFDLDNGVGVLDQAEAPTSVAQPEVAQRRSLPEEATNQIVDGLKNVSLERPQARTAQEDNGVGQGKSRISKRASPGKQVTLSDTFPETAPIPDASASPGTTEKREGNQTHTAIQGSTSACPATKTDVEGQKWGGNGGAGSSCHLDTQGQIQPHAGNGEAGGSCAEARSVRSQPQTVSEGAGNSFPADTVYAVQTLAEEAVSSSIERRHENQAEARDGGAGSSCPTTSRVRTQQEGHNEETGSASPEKRSEESQPQGRSPGCRSRSPGAARTFDPQSASSLDHMVQRLQGCSNKMGHEDMRALQEAIDEENQMYLDLLRGDVRAVRYFNRLGRDQDRVNRIRASQVRAMYSAGLLHHPSRTPMYFGNEVVLFEQPVTESHGAIGSERGTTGRPGEAQPEAAKSESTQPRDEAAMQTDDSDTNIIPECPQRPNTPLTVLDDKHISRLNRIRRQRSEQVRDTSSANVRVCQRTIGTDPPESSNPHTEATVDYEQAPNRSVVSPPSSDQPVERFDTQIASEPSIEVRHEPQIASEPSREVRPEPQIASEPSREVRPEPQIATEPPREARSEQPTASEPHREARFEPQIVSEPPREARPEPQIASCKAQGSNHTEQNVINQGPERGLSSRSAPTERPPVIDAELNNEGERSRRVAREIIREFNRALDPLFSVSPICPIHPFHATSTDQSGQPDTRETLNPPGTREALSSSTAPRIAPDELRFLNSLEEIFRYVETPRALRPLSRFSESELVLLRIRLFARRAELQATRAARELNSVGLDLISRTFRFMAGSLSTLGRHGLARQDPAQNTQSTSEPGKPGSQGAANFPQGSNQEYETYGFLNNETAITNLIVLLERQIVDTRTRQSGSLAATFQPSNPGASREAQLAWQYQNIEAESAERRRRMLEEFGQPGQDMGAFMRFFWRRYVFQPSGLNPSELNTLPTVRHSEATDQGESSSFFQCSICLYEYKAGDDVRVLTCGHRFHKECVDEWLQRTATCPVCRARIKPIQKRS